MIQVLPGTLALKRWPPVRGRTTMAEPTYVNMTGLRAAGLCHMPREKHAKAGTHAAARRGAWAGWAAAREGRRGPTAGCMTKETSGTCVLNRAALVAAGHGGTEHSGTGVVCGCVDATSCRIWHGVCRYLQCSPLQMTSITAAYDVRWVARSGVAEGSGGGDANTCLGDVREVPSISCRLSAGL